MRPRPTRQRVLLPRSRRCSRSSHGFAWSRPSPQFARHQALAMCSRPRDRLPRLPQIAYYTGTPRCLIGTPCVGRDDVMRAARSGACRQCPGRAKPKTLQIVRRCQLGNRFTAGQASARTSKRGSGAWALPSVGHLFAYDLTSAFPKYALGCRVLGITGRSDGRQTQLRESELSVRWSCVSWSGERGERGSVARGVLRVHDDVDERHPETLGCPEGACLLSTRYAPRSAVR
jgi:hypothetical protein